MAATSVKSSLCARLTRTSTHGLSFDCDLVLPDFDDPSREAWPAYEVPQIAESPIFRGPKHRRSGCATTLSASAAGRQSLDDEPSALFPLPPAARCSRSR